MPGRSSLPMQWRRWPADKMHQASTLERGLVIREVLQTEFRFDFWKGPRQISAGPGLSTAEEVDPNFMFCKPNFLFRFGLIDREMCAGSVGDSPRRDVQEDYREVNLCLLLDWPIVIANRETRSHTERPF